MVCLCLAQKALEWFFYSLKETAGQERGGEVNNQDEDVGDGLNPVPTLECVLGIEGHGRFNRLGIWCGCTADDGILPPGFAAPPDSTRNPAAGAPNARAPNDGTPATETNRFSNNTCWFGVGGVDGVDQGPLTIVRGP